MGDDDKEELRGGKSREIFEKERQVNEEQEKEKQVKETQMYEEQVKEKQVKKVKEKQLKEERMRRLLMLGGFGSCCSDAKVEGAAML